MSTELFRPGVRAVSAHFLDLSARLVRLLDTDMGPAMVYLAVVIAGFPEDAGRPDRPEGLELEAERRPISAYALSRALSMPYETVRRHLRLLVEHRHIVKQDDGFIVPLRLFEDANFLTWIEETWTATDTLRRMLRKMGHKCAKPVRKPDRRLKIWVGYLNARLFLDGCALIHKAVGRDLLTGLVYLTINRANTLHVEELVRKARSFKGTNNLWPDDDRRPVSVYQIARDLRTPYETARRHTQHLVKAGLCVSTPEGLVVPGAVVGSPAMLEGALGAWISTLNLVGEMDRLGI